MAKEKKSPVATFGSYPCGGGSTVEAAVWANETEIEGRQVTTYAVSFDRNYREGDSWKKTKAMRTQDVPVLIFALGKAYDWILGQKDK